MVQPSAHLLSKKGNMGSILLQGGSLSWMPFRTLRHPTVIGTCTHHRRKLEAVQEQCWSYYRTCEACDLNPDLRWTLKPSPGYKRSNCNVFNIMFQNISVLLNIISLDSLKSFRTQMSQQCRNIFDLNEELGDNENTDVISQYYR